MIFFRGVGVGVRGRVYGPRRDQGKQTEKNPDKASVSRSNDTEKYLPCWEGCVVEAGEAVGTAVDITVGSDDDVSVKEHDKNTLTQYFSLAQFVSDLAREKKRKRKRKKQNKTKGNYIQPPSWPHAWSIEDLLYMAQMMRTCACWTNAENPEGLFLARSGSPS